jgi:hypothetical protein
MTYNVIIEGQTIPVPEEIGASDEAVKRALSPFYPEVANAMITRVASGETTTITVVKRAGSKGMDALADLLEMPASQNPAVELYEEIQMRDASGMTDPIALLAIDQRIERALEEGERQAAAVDWALERLERSKAQPAPELVLGF